MFKDDGYYCGIDVGAVSIKVCLMSSPANLAVFQNIAQQHSHNFETPETGSLTNDARYAMLLTTYQRTKGAPLQAALDLMRQIFGYLPKDQNIALAATGSGGKIISQSLGIPFKNEFQAIANSMGEFYPKVKTILEMGGDCSKYIVLDTTPSGGFSGIVDYEVNGECAAGTGSFLDQQASRLLYKIEDVGDVVLTAEKAANIAGRCSVFAKSDMIHAQQKGFQPPEILKGLCQAVVRNFKGTIIKGKPIHRPVAFIGGLAANKGIVVALKEILAMDDDSDLIIPNYFTHMAAIGASLLEARSGDLMLVESFLNKINNFISSTQQFDTMPPIRKDSLVLLRDRESGYQFSAQQNPLPVYLGVDIGSVTTKLALVDEDGELVKGIYTKTQARPIEVVKKGLREIELELGEKIRVLAVGTTGSGRELIGELIGADIIKDEITAHKTGAMHISNTMTGEMVDTIFDIGGQDSKYIYIEDGVVVDFTMNEACAAGTGSFLEEQAEKLGINIKDEFAELALSSTRPVRLGERCTVFMEKEIIPFLQRGAQKNDIVAGLAYSIVINYLNRVVRGRKIGDVIYFQGGTAYNDAVAAAFTTVLKKKIIVPPHNGIIGAIGAALLARENLSQNRQATGFRGFNLDHIQYSIRSFTCKGCTNFCDIQEFTVQGKRTYWGDKCSERYRKEIKVKSTPVIPDLIKFRRELLYRSQSENEEGTLKIGIPRAMYFWDQYPFWQTYFNQL
ncbi:MAG TPA: hypothetical protein ENN22_01580, partial [bacterium]|nr:hypothetical protein [bacterium]